MDFELWWALPILMLFFGLGWGAARMDIKYLLRESRALPLSYFRGLNFLLNEQPDKAIESFIEVVKVNPETVTWQRIDHPHWEAMLKAMVEEHVAETKSPLGARLLNDWNRCLEHFWQVVPKEMLSRLPMPLSAIEAKRA